ncbi:MAG TPA: amino acid ABC transporter permease [Mycobacteriales bacterium]|jgi:polar amino acid transport system permease protein|nr:amino acid ABC transporter permease [Mycobacteriales bacterium]
MTSPEVQTGTADSMKAVPVRHPWRWVTAVVIAVLAAMLIHSLAFSTVQRGGESRHRWEWNVVGSYLFDQRILHGVSRTLLLTVLCMLIGVVLGTILAVMRLSQNPIVSGSSWLYIWFFRGTPVLLQIFFWYYIAAIYPHLSIGVPFGPELVHIDMTNAINKLSAALLGLGLNEAAYMAEIVRAGIISVDEGQSEAASALGMPRLTIMRRIVLPQAMRVIIPPTGNETISMLKTTSLAFTIAYTELLYSAQLIYAANYKTIPLLVVAALWYLAITSVLYVGQYFLERRYGRGTVFAQPDDSFVQRVARMFLIQRTHRAAATSLSSRSDHPR